MTEGPAHSFLLSSTIFAASSTLTARPFLTSPSAFFAASATVVFAAAAAAAPVVTTAAAVGEAGRLFSRLSCSHMASRRGSAGGEQRSVGVRAVGVLVRSAESGRRGVC